MDFLIDDSDRLKPCPFCGGEAEIITLGCEEGAINDGAKCVQCINNACSASSCLVYPVMDDVTDLLMELWNRRHKEQK